MIVNKRSGSRGQDGLRLAREKSMISALSQSLPGGTGMPFSISGGEVVSDMVSTIIT